MSPAELGLSLSADVLRLPYPLATRVVLAEIVSLHAATGCCCCSDPHLAARLGVHKDTASVAVKQLRADGLLLGDTDRAAGNVRVLVPVPAAIAAKAAANPYPEFPGRATRKKPEAYPEIPGSPTRKKPEALPGNSGANTTLETSIKTSSEVSSSTTPFGRGAGVAAEQGQGGGQTTGDKWAEAEVVTSEPDRPAQPPKKKIAPKKKVPRPEPRARKPEVPFAESELASYEAFAAAFAGTDWELANLPYYHQQVLAWRKDGEPPLRRDWKATSTKFMLNDVADNRLQLAPGVQSRNGGGYGQPVANGESPGGYHSSRSNR